MDELDQLLAESAPKASSQSPAVKGVDELDQLLAESAPKQSGNAGQLPSFTQYANKVVDDNKSMIQDMLAAKGPSYAIQSMKNEPSKDLQALTSLGTGVLQGGADVGYGLSQVPAALVNSAAWMTNSPYRMDYGVKPQASAYPYQKESVQNNPAAYYGGEAIGNVAMLAPGFSGATTAPQILGRSGALGAATYPSSNPGEKLAAGGLSMAATAVPLGIEKGAQGIIKGITGTEIDPSVAAAAKDIGMDKLPNVLLTKNDNLKNELTNSVLPGTGNESHRQLARANKDQFDQKSNEFIGSFNVNTPEGAPLMSSTGGAPSQSEVKENVLDKINAAHSKAKVDTSALYDQADQIAKASGDTSNVKINSYAKKLQDMASGDGNYSDKAVKFANSELKSLSESGQLPSYEKDFASKSMGMQENKGIKFQEATDLDRKINGMFGKNTGAMHDPQLHHDLSELKSSLNNDIDRSVGQSGNEDLADSWRTAKKTYETKVRPFYDNKFINKYVQKDKTRPDSDSILTDLVKSDNPNKMNELFTHVPEIKDDLGFLKLREAGGKFNKKNNPDINNALMSIGNMSDDAGVALFGPDKWKKLDSFKTLHGAIKPYLEFGANPNTGARVQQSEAKQMAGDAAQAFAAITAATGHPVGAAVGLAGKAANKIGVNKMKASLMTNPKAFESANAQSLLTPSARKAYQSLMVAGSDELVNQANKQGE